MGLVNDNVFPLELLQRAHAHAHSLESCQTNVKLARNEIVFKLLLAFFLCSNEVEHSDFRAPQFELLLPVGYDCLGDDNQEIVLNLLVLT